MKTEGDTAPHPHSADQRDARPVTIADTCYKEQKYTACEHCKAVAYRATAYGGASKQRASTGSASGGGGAGGQEGQDGQEGQGVSASEESKQTRDTPMELVEMRDLMPLDDPDLDHFPLDDFGSDLLGPVGGIEGGYTGAGGGSGGGGGRGAANGSGSGSGSGSSMTPAELDALRITDPVAYAAERRRGRPQWNMSCGTCPCVWHDWCISEMAEEVARGRLPEYSVGSIRLDAPGGVWHCPKCRYVIGCSVRVRYDKMRWL